MNLDIRCPYNYKVNGPGKEVLLPYIHQYIHFETIYGRGLQKAMYPSDHVSLVFNFNKTLLDDVACSDMFLVGLHENIHVMQSEEECIDTVIVKFSPIGFSAFGNVCAINITGKIVDAKEVFGEVIVSLYQKMETMRNVQERQDLLDVFFSTVLNRSHTIETCYSELTSTIQNDPNYKIPKTKDISYRHLSRLFKQIVGVNIQTYRRLVRFELARQLLIDEKDNSLTDIGYRSGYYDQAHFAKEF